MFFVIYPPSLHEGPGWLSFFLSVISYMSSNNVTLYQIGSSNPAVLYTGSWFTGDDSDGDATLHGTRTAGSNVTFTFNGAYYLSPLKCGAMSSTGELPPGTFAAAYGTVDASGARFTYTIDSAAPEPVALPGLTPPDHTAVLFSTPQLAFGEHTLLMSNTQDGPTLWLEYITYTGAELERRADQVRNASQPGAASPQQPKHAGLPPSTVVLVVLCSLLFLAILVVGGWLVHRRRHRWHLDRPVNDPSFKEHGFDILPSTSCSCCCGAC